MARSDGWIQRAKALASRVYEAIRGSMAPEPEPVPVPVRVRAR